MRSVQEILLTKIYNMYLQTPNQIHRSKALNVDLLQGMKYREKLKVYKEKEEKKIKIILCQKASESIILRK